MDVSKLINIVKKPKNPVNGQQINTTPAYKDPVVVNGKLMDRSNAPTLPNAVDMSKFNQSSSANMSGYNANSTAPTMPTIEKFQAPNYSYLGYDQALKQAQDRLKPLQDNETRQALDGVKNQAMGTGFYGQLPTVQLSADTSAQIANSYAAKQAELAQSLQDADKQWGERAYDKAFQLWQVNNDNAFRGYGLQRSAFESDRDYGFNVDRAKVSDQQWQDTFDYNKGRDVVADKQWQDTYDRGVFESDRAYNQDEKWRNVDNGWRNREWNRQLERDEVGDSQWSKEFAENQRQFNKQLAISQYKASRGGGGGSSSGSSSKQDPRMVIMDNLLGRVEYFASSKDAEAQFFREKDKIVSQIGQEGFNYLINYTRGLPSNFSGGVYRNKKNG